ncbi:hypothetical protein [Reinekea thalattae]|uniref:Uncharacterized protein n=1 Tax=Reinekea thalattae TaxID=2593301 RepID=A0A5C8ZAQ2_9GAMM|nr:hypothetical protein [Reinekea thalattae]TXR53976.1 hypothetical protein FME95_05350 [Reinekea thalattae]
MIEIKIGLNVTNEGLKFYGSDEVNEKIEKGAKILSINPSQFFIKEHPEKDTDKTKSITLRGWEMVVELEE